MIEDLLFERLARKARSQGLTTVEQLLARISEPPSGGDRHTAVEQIRDLRTRLRTQYGEMPDSTELIRQDRAR
jgi:hypothetical protein